MLYYYRIDSSKGTDLAKSNNSKECSICNYWFFNHKFKLQDSVCNAILSVNISDIAIISVKDVGYCCIIHNIWNNSETINLLKNLVLNDCG